MINIVLIGGPCDGKEVVITDLVSSIEWPVYIRGEDDKINGKADLITLIRAVYDFYRRRPDGILEYKFYRLDIYAKCEIKVIKR